MNRSNLAKKDKVLPGKSSLTFIEQKMYIILSPMISSPYQPSKMIEINKWVKEEGKKAADDEKAKCKS